ncbi:MAG: wax ester/triacylglycerol synthase domain-containing protein, partial [Actinomycetes bacterium]
FVSSRLPQMPRFRERVVPSRTMVRPSKWIAAEPDLAHHVTAMELTPGSRIDGAVSELMMVPMDRHRPLWDATMLTGYSDQRWTCVFRLHHSIADGQGAVILLGRMLDIAAEGGMTLADGIEAMSFRTEEPAEGDVETHSWIDSVTTRTVRGIERGFETAGHFVSTYPDTVRTLLELAPRPPSDLTGMVSPQRKWVSGHYSLADLKVARKAFKGVTINDMVLSSVALGFRRLLESRGQDPTGRTVRAVMPVSLRKDMSANNQVSVLPAPLPAGQIDPIKRMRSIRDATEHGKRSMAPVIIERVIKGLEIVTPASVSDFVVSRAGVSTQLIGETLVTNVPGPFVPLYFMGSTIVGSLPIIPIEGSMRIIIGVTSYCGDLNIGVTGDGLYAPDVDVLLAGILEGLDELVALAAAKGR